MQQVYIKRQNVLWQKVATRVAAVILIIIVFNLFQAQIRNSFYVISSPFSRVFLQAGTSTNSLFSSVFTFGATKKENELLHAQNQQLLLQIAQLKDSAAQNQAAMQFIQNPQVADFSVVLSKTIGIDRAADTITLDKGSADGIQEGMPVISSQHVVYGKVSAVYKNFSEVTLISAPKSVVAVKVQNQDSTQPDINGAVKGAGNASAYLDLVSSDATISPGQSLITSGLEGVFPRDLLVGTIVSVNQNDAKAFQTASITPAFDIGAADNLFIITNYKKK